MKITHYLYSAYLIEAGKKLMLGPRSKGLTFTTVMKNVHPITVDETLLHSEEWKAINQPDVLMIPIGGKAIHNTMDEDEALEAVRLMNPAMVLPCHYNCPAFFTSRYNPADDAYFKRGGETGFRVRHFAQRGFG